jgi:hypothetical protein
LGSEYLYNTKYFERSNTAIGSGRTGAKRSFCHRSAVSGI